MITRTTRIQLLIFALVTVVTVSLIVTNYLHVPARLGLGAIRVTAEFEAAGGLYENANVTYRGVTVGRVEAVELTDDGVAARMRINSSAHVPADVTATVQSMSAVGEQYVDLVPPDGSAGQALLRNGDVIGKDRTAVGQDVAGLLDEADQLVSTLADSRLKELLAETFKAFNGSGPELARLVESARLLVDEANANWPQTEALIDRSAPLLEAQIRSGDDIRAAADGLARLTTELRGADAQFRNVLATVPGTAETAQETFDGIRPSFPALAASLANFGRVGVIYRKSIEHALVVFPALFQALLTVAYGVPKDEGGKLDFKIDLGDPPPCSVGFLPPTEIRSPADTTLRDLPLDMYCKVPHNDPSVVRGARNYPCQEFPGKRAPTVQLCRDPEGYKPLGTNPWRGPTIPVGTPVTDGRNILPPNHYPYIPPENDPDPGIPYAPGFYPPDAPPPGPGPAPHQPWQPFPPPPDGPPPAVTPYLPPAPFPPQDPLLPYPAEIPPPPPPVGTGPVPPGNPPQAAGPQVTVYDQQTGKFVDPDGNVGVYAPGAEKLRPAETWVDLMLDPRQI